MLLFLTTNEFALPFKDPILIFTLILSIILLAPIILNKLRIPHLIGLIIAGAIIGPNGFNLILRDSSFELLGTVGLLYIMFLAGLEMDLNDFKKNSRKSVVFGLYTFAFPFILGSLACFYILKFSPIASILLASMLCSHTLLTYPIVSKLGVAKNPAINVTVGGTLITDTLALLAVAIIAGASTGNIDNEFWIRLGISFVIFLILLIGIFPIISRWFFKRISDNISQYIYVLCVMFISALLALYSGLEGIIGAFFAGLILNRLIPKTSPLMNRIEFVGNAIFIPFFLIGVGMLIDFKIFLGDVESLLIALVITTVAIVSKYLAAFLVQKTYKYSNDQRSLIFGLSNSRAAATLAIVTVGMRIGLFNEEILNATILMILITCTVSSFITQRGAQNIAKTEMADNVENEEISKERILIPLNNPEMAIRLINLSIILKNSKSKNNLFALNVISNKDSDNVKDEKHAKKLMEIASKAASATDNNITELMRYDIDIVNAIISSVKEHKITDLVMGLHEKKDISDSFLGALTEGILSRCDATTFIYKAFQPIATVKRHLIVIPKYADQEIGFPFWLSKIWNIGKNAKTKVIVYASEKTLKYIQIYQEKFPIEVEYKIFDDWDDFLILARDIKPDDSVTIVMSRAGKPSYSPIMSKIPSYLNKYLRSNNFILVYPIQTVSTLDTEDIDRMNPALDYDRITLFRKKVQGLLGGGK